MKILDPYAQVQRNLVTKNQWLQLYLVVLSIKRQKLIFANVFDLTLTNILVYVQLHIAYPIRHLFDIRSKFKFQQLNTCHQPVLIHTKPPVNVVLLRGS